MRSWHVGVVALVLVAGCAGSSAPTEPQPTPSPTGPVARAQLEAMLLQPTDLLGLGQRRLFADAGLTTQSTPQLSLCRAPVAVAPHEIANVIAEAGKPRGVKVFEVLSVFADDAAATAVFALHLADARACAKYDVDGLAHRIVGLKRVDLGAGADAVQYAVVTSDVLSGDVRTYARKGNATVLISGFGVPPSGVPLLTYQADLMRKALARLG